MDASDRTLLGTLVDGTGAFLARDDRRRSVYVIGKPGTGKSSLLASMMRQDLEAGRGFTFLDPKGDTAEFVADCIPKGRYDDALYWEPFDGYGAVGFNVFSDVPPAQRSLVADNIVSTFVHLWKLDVERTPRLLYILDNSVRLLLDRPGSTLLDISRILTDDDYRRGLVSCCGDRAIAAFWRDEYDRYDERFRRDAIAPLQNKAGQFRASPSVRRIIGQPKSAISVRKLMDGERCLIVNLSKGRLGEQTSHLLGSLLATSFAQAASARADTPEDDRRDHTLYVDEFQNFANPVLASILSESRGLRLSMVLAHQFLKQVPELLQEAVLGTASTVVAFRIGAKDAPLVADELALTNRLALAQTRNHQAWIKLLKNGAPTEPHVLATGPPEAPLGSLKAARANARARYMTPAEKIDRIIEASFPEPASRKRRNPDRQRTYLATEGGLRRI